MTRSGGGPQRALNRLDQFDVVGTLARERVGRSDRACAVVGEHPDGGATLAPRDAERGGEFVLGGGQVIDDDPGVEEVRVPKHRLIALTHRLSRSNTRARSCVFCTFMPLPFIGIWPSEKKSTRFGTL